MRDCHITLGKNRFKRYSCRTVSRVNEYDDKLETFITVKEEDQRDVLIIGGVNIFLPSGRGEDSIFVADA